MARNGQHRPHGGHKHHRRRYGRFPRRSPRKAGGGAPSSGLEAQLQHAFVSLGAENLGIALAPGLVRKLAMAEVVFRNLQQAPAIDNVIAWRPGNLNLALGRF